MIFASHLIKQIFYGCFLLLTIGIPSSVLADWSCYDINGAITGTDHQCVCEKEYCNENTCVDNGGIWAENCRSCHCEDGAEEEPSTGLTGDGCYDISINTCTCDPSVCSESTCAASGGQWATSCRSCQCSGSATPSGGAGACFSEWATAEVLQNNAEQQSMLVAMKDLRVGDRVKTATGRYEPVYAFGHFHETKPSAFIQIYIAMTAAPLEITADHLIFVDGKKSPVRADSIRIGDVLHHQPSMHTSASISANTSTAAVVTSISGVLREGIYAPLTPDGTIVVNGIVASAYAAISSKSTSEKVEISGWSFFGINQADAIHLGLSPLRLLCSTGDSTFSICKELDDKTRMNKYVAWGVGMIHWAETQSAVLQLIMMALALIMGALILAFEKICALDALLVAGVSILAATIRYRCYNSVSLKKSKVVL